MVNHILQDCNLISKILSSDKDSALSGDNLVYHLRFFLLRI